MTIAMRHSIQGQSQPLFIRILLCCCLLGLPAVGSEVLVLQNGDRISGNIVGQSPKSIRIQTAYAGVIEVQREHLGHIQTASSGRAQSIPGTGAKSAIPKPDEIPVEASGAASKKQFEGSLNVGIKMENGNSDKDEIDTDFSASYQTGSHRFRAKGGLEYDLRDGENIKRDWYLTPTYDYFIDENLFLSMLYSAKQEKFADLHLRQTMGPSVGYQFFRGEPVSLMSSLGLLWVDENFSDSEDNSYAALGWNFDYQHAFYKGKVKFYHRHNSLLSTERVDKFLWHSWTGLKVPLVGSIVGSAEVELDYDSQPADDAETLDTTLRFKIGYEW